MQVPGSNPGGGSNHHTAGDENKEERGNFLKAYSRGIPGAPKPGIMDQ